MTIKMFIDLENLSMTVRSLGNGNLEDCDNSIGAGKAKKCKKRTFSFIPAGARLCFGGRDRSGKMMFLMTMPSTGDRIIAVACLPDGVITRPAAVLTIYTLSAASTHITFPVSFFVTPLLNHEAVVTAQTHIKRDGAAPRDEAMGLMDLDVTKLVNFVQDYADLHASSAITIIESCGLHVKGKATHDADVFRLEQGLSGEILLFAGGAPDHTCHQWFYSADGITFTQMTSTIWAKTKKSGLPVNQYAWFDHQVIYSDGPHDLEGAIKITVK
ncbi:MAG: hypothetical protein WCL14_06450 [Bacteroidota bacterium]